MISKPKLLDLCCRAGGCSVGYERAGFDVVGVDIEPQKDYPFGFHQADAFEFARSHWRQFDAIHASPHCQGYLPRGKHMKRADGIERPRQIDQFREMLQSFGKPWVIENIERSPILDLPLFGTFSITLCGAMFGLRVYRHRKFESNVRLFAPHHPKHTVRCAQQGRPAREDQFITVTGNCSGVAQARIAMGIDWMVRDDLSQAIPPAYTEFIGGQLLQSIEAGSKA